MPEDDARPIDEIERETRMREAENRAVVLEMIGDLPEADAKPPSNMLFICKLNPVTTEEVRVLPLCCPRLQFSSCGRRCSGMQAPLLHALMPSMPSASCCRVHGVSDSTVLAPAQLMYHGSCRGQTA